MTPEDLQRDGIRFAQALITIDQLVGDDPDRHLDAPEDAVWVLWAIRGVLADVTAHLDEWHV